MDDVFFEPGRYVGDFEVDLSDEVPLASDAPMVFEAEEAGCALRCTFVPTPVSLNVRSTRKLRIEVSRTFDVPPDIHAAAAELQHKLPCATQAGFAVSVVLRSACEAFVVRFSNLLRYTLGHVYLDERTLRVALHNLWLFRGEYCEPLSFGEGIEAPRKVRGPEPIPLSMFHLHALVAPACHDEPTLDARLLVEASYALHLGRLAEAVLHASAACEVVAKRSLLGAISANASDVVRSPSAWPVLELLERDTARVLGASFAQEEPEAFAELRGLFDCRGRLLAGGPCQYRYGAGIREATAHDVERWVLAVHRTSAWFNGRLRRRERGAPITAPILKRGKREAS